MVENSIKVTVTYINLRQEWNKWHIIVCWLPTFNISSVIYTSPLSHPPGVFLTLGAVSPKIHILVTVREGPDYLAKQQEIFRQRAMKTELNKQEFKETPGMKQKCLGGGGCSSAFSVEFW